MFFDSWVDLGRTVLVGALSYVALVAILRLSGKRTLAKMNAFDLVVTVSLGSTLASVLLDKQIALAEGVLAFVMLAGLQFVVAWSVLRSKTIAHIAKSEPRVLLADGAFVDAALRAERVTRGEVESAIRRSGFGELAKVAAVVLETDGSLSVISREDAGSGDALPKGHGG